MTSQMRNTVQSIKLDFACRTKKVTPPDMTSVEYSTTVAAKS